MTDSHGTHREILDLLPWYVNGTLPEHHRARLEAHFRECLPCHAALREERKLQGLLRDQDDLPLGPSHGLNALLDRIDRGQRAPRPVRRLVPLIGYGIAAGIGGGLVWLWLAVLPVNGADDGEFETLSATPAVASPPSATSEPPRPQIDVVFAATPTAAELEAFGKELAAARVAGPSEIGRYTFTLDRTAADIEMLLESLRRDPRIRFAGRSYADVNAGGTLTESSGEAR
jgi:anti-sigma factor RsiW